jgi:hypothetical protein
MNDPVLKLFRLSPSQNPFHRRPSARRACQRDSYSELNISKKGKKDRNDRNLSGKGSQRKSRAQQGQTKAHPKDCRFPETVYRVDFRKRQSTV